MTKPHGPSLASDAVLLTFSKIITLSISMISVMLLSRFRTLEEYGTLTQLLIVIQVTTTVLILGLPNSINYFLARSQTDNEKSQFLSVFYTLSFILSIFIGFFLFNSSNVISSYFGNTQILKFKYLLAIYPCARIVSSSIDNILIVSKKAKLLLVFKFANSSMLLAIILSVWSFRLSFPIYVLMFLLVEVLFAIIALIIVFRITKDIHLSFDKALIRQILKFSLPIGLASVVGTLNIELDKLIIGRYFDTSMLAIYANSAREMPVVIIASSISAVLLPVLTRMIGKGKDLDALHIWGKATKVGFIVICFLATALFVYATDFISLLYSSKYVFGASVFRIYCVVLLFRCTYFGMVLNAYGQTKFILYSSIISLVINVSLNIVFIELFGFEGPAIATFISIAIVQLSQLFFTARIAKVPFSRAMPWKDLLRIFGLNIIIGLFFYLIKELIPLELVLGQMLETLILGMLWFIIYFSIMFRSLRALWVDFSLIVE